MGIKTLKRLKPDAVPTIFARSIDYLQASSSQSTTTLAGRPLSKRRQQRMVVAELLSEGCDTSLNTSDDMDAASSSILPLGQHTSDNSPPAIVTPYLQGLDKGTQAETSTNVVYMGQNSVATQCNLLDAPPLELLEPSLSLDDSFAEPEEADHDTSFCISQEENTTEEDTEAPLPHDEVKYLVFLSHLLSLFTQCRSCHQHCNGEVAQQMGTFIGIKQECHHCGHKWKWNSQPFIKDIPAGNILLSAAILFSGSTPTKSLHFLKCLNMACIKERTFHYHQTKYLEPAVVDVWKNSQQTLLSKCKSPVVIGGDGRADSPGHSAKYGSYGIVDMSTNKVIHIELVQSNEVTSSNAMEYQGLIRALDFLEQNSIVVETLITDRHKQIAKYMRQAHPEITHQFDVWHVSKGIKKKLARLSTNKDCSIVAEWIKSITNHLHWCVASAPEDNSDDIIKRWKSLMEHIIDTHDECYHADLSLDERRKKWLIPGSKAYEKLIDITLSAQLQKDMKRLSPIHQTSSLEAYHSVVNHFAPKLLQFSYAGIYCRLLLAALHFNENFNREQAKTASGSERIRIVYPKQKKGEYTPKPVSVPKTYHYADKLMKKAFQFCQEDTDKPPLPISPPSLASAHEHPDKGTIPQFSRYKQ